MVTCEALAAHDHYKKQRRERMCGKKLRFKTEEAALNRLISLSRTYGAGRVYQCPYCKKWHITTKVD